MATLPAGVGVGLSAAGIAARAPASRVTLIAGHIDERMAVVRGLRPWGIVAVDEVGNDRAGLVIEHAVLAAVIEFTFEFSQDCERAAITISEGRLVLHHDDAGTGRQPVLQTGHGSELEAVGEIDAG